MSGFNVNENDIRNLQEKFDNMQFSEQKKVIRGVYNRCANILKKQTKANLSKITTSKGVRVKMSNKWSKGIRHRVRFNQGKESSVTVHIMGYYKLKWFEKPIKTRYTKKGYHRGTLKPNYFFKSAKSQSSNKMQNEMSNSMQKNINKIWNKRTRS